MKKIDISTKKYPNKFALVDDKDFEWLSKWKWIFDGGTGYVIRTDTRDGKIYLHRFILETPEGLDTDHINNFKLDNKRKNLRIATSSQNGMNKLMQRNNTSGFRGVKLQKSTGLWESRIKIDKKQILLGVYNSKLEAGIAYNHGALKYFGEFAKFNPISNWHKIYPIKRSKYYNLSRKNNSGNVGISYAKDKNKWRARITINQNTIQLGYFINKLDAIKIRNEALQKHFGVNYNL